LKSIIKQYVYNNFFIINILSLYKNKTPLTQKQLINIIKTEKKKINLNKSIYKNAINKDDIELIKFIYDNDARENDIVVNEMFQILDEDERVYHSGKKNSYLNKIKNGELKIDVDERFINNLDYIEERRRIIKENIRLDRTSELKDYVLKNNLFICYFNVDGFDVLTYSIRYNSSIEMLKFILPYYTNLDYTITIHSSSIDKYESPLSCALAHNKFDVANLLLKYGADKCYKINKLDIIHHLYISRTLNITNLNYMISHNFIITPELVNTLIINNKNVYLKLLFKKYIFTNEYILKLLNIYKNHNPLSKAQFNAIVLKEKNKIEIKYTWFCDALKYYNNDAIVLFLNHVGDDFNLFLNKFKTSEIFEILDNAVERNNYILIEQLLSSKLIDFNIIKIDEFLSRDFFSPERVNQNFNSMEFFIEKMLNNVTFDFRNNSFNKILLVIGKTEHIELVEFFIQRSLNHKTFDFKIIAFERLLLLINKINEINKKEYIDLVYFMIDKSLSHPTFDFKIISFENVLLEISQYNDNNLIKLFIRKSFIHETFDLEKVNIKNVLITLKQLDDNISALEFFIEELLNSKSFNIKNINIEELLLISINMENGDFTEYLIKILLEHSTFNFEENVKIKEILLTSNKIENFEVFKYFIEKILSHHTLKFNKVTMEQALLALSKMNDISKIEFILKNIYNNEKFNGEIVHPHHLNFEKILLSANRYDNVYIMTFILEKLFNLPSLDLSKGDVNQINFSVMKEMDTQYLSLILNTLIKLHNLKLIRLLFENENFNSSIDFNIKDRNYEYIIITVSAMTKYNVKDLEIFEYLLDHGADFNVKDINGNSLLLIAIKDGNYVILQNLFKRNITIESNVDKKDSFVVDYDEKIRNIKHLINDGNTSSFKIRKTINELDFYGYSLLHYALIREDKNAVKYLIDQGADVNFNKNRNLRGHSALDISIHIKNKELFLMLLESKTLLINKSNSKHETPILTLLKINNFSVEEKADWFIHLIQKGANVNVFDKTKKSLLFYAFKGNFLSIIKVLINKGISIDRSINENQIESILISAIDNDDSSIIDFIAKYKIKIYTNDIIKSIISKNKIDLLKVLISNNLDINMKDKDEKTCLIYAIENDNEPIIQYLLDNNASIKDVNNNIDVMESIIKNGNLSLLKILIKNHLDINEKDKFNHTLLNYSINFGKEDMMNYLIQCNADFYNIKDKVKIMDTIFKSNNLNLLKSIINNHYINEILEEIIQKNRIDLLKLLIANGLDINKKYENGKTILIYALEKRNITIVHYLIGCNADVNSLNNYIIKEIISEDKLDLLKFFVANHLNIESKESTDNNKIIYQFDLTEENDSIKKHMNNIFGINASLKNNKIEIINPIIQKDELDLLKMIIPGYLDVNTKDENGNTPLIYAIQAQNISIIKYLIDQKADLEIVNKSIKILENIVKDNNLDLLKYLINQKLDIINAKDFEKNTLLIYAVRYENESIINYLLEKGARTDDLKIDIDIELFEKILNLKHPELFDILYNNNNIDVNKKNDAGKTMLHYAIECGNEQIIEYLMNCGAKISNIEKEILECLKRSHNLNVLKILIANNFDINMEDQYGKTLLNYAILDGDEAIINDLINCGAYIRNFDTEIINSLKNCYNLSVLKILTDNGFNINMEDEYGKTLLIHAIQEDAFNIVKDLIENGADANKEDRDGNTPLIAAIKNENVEIVEYLLGHDAFKNVENEYGDTPLILSIKIGSDRMVKCLIEWGAYISDTNYLKNINEQYNYDEKNLYIYNEINELLNNCRRKY